MMNKTADTPYCGVNQEKISTSHPVLNALVYNELVEFIVDRYNIHLLKDVAQQPAPWTGNPILLQYKFTNVRREHDRQTRYLITHIVNNPKLSLTEKVYNIFLFRGWNNWSTMETFRGPWMMNMLRMPFELKEKARRIYDQLEDKNRLWYSNAYIHSGSKTAWKSYDPSETNSALLPFQFLMPMIDNDTVMRMLAAPNQQRCVDEIMKIKGFSTFTAYQVFVDCCYIPDFPFTEREFVMSGPGCHNGLSVLFDDNDGLTDEELLFWLRDNSNINTDIEASTLFADLPPNDRFMNIMSLENCMCELSKYHRTKLGTGKPRNKYNGTGVQL